jgi:hypothetical protein
MARMLRLGASFYNFGTIQGIVLLAQNVRFGFQIARMLLLPGCIVLSLSLSLSFVLSVAFHIEQRPK